MSKEYRAGKEYSLFEIIQYNLKMWWLAGIMVVIFAALLGGYKVVTLRPYVENEVYQDKMQVKSAFYVSQFNNGSVVERANDIMKIADSSRTYEIFREKTGYQLTIEEYCNMFDAEQTEASNVVTFYITFPYTHGNFSINDEKEGMAFMEGLVEAVDLASQELTGEKALLVLDEPYATKEVEKLVSFSISQSDYKKAIVKAVTAGICLGIIVEVALYTLWMLLYKKPKNAKEIQECLGADIVDVFKKESQSPESYRKAAMFLKGDKAHNIINCIPVNARTDDPIKIAMCYANEQKKTLFLDMEDSDDKEHSISGYVIGKAQKVNPEKMNDYLETVHRSLKMENGFDIAGTEKFAEYLANVSREYDYIVIGSRDIAKAAEGYRLAELSGKTLILCNRKRTGNEQLYEIRNTMEINDLSIDGVLVYDL